MSTQQYMEKVVEDVGEDDDFKSAAWISTINYVNAFGGTVTGCLGDVDNFLKKGKLEQILGIVKSCSPNMLGDLNVTLKDLSGCDGIGGCDLEYPNTTKLVFANLMALPYQRMSCCLPTSDLDTMSLDDLYNHLKVYKAEVQKKSKPNTQNIAFISSTKHSKGNDKVNTASAYTASRNERGRRDTYRQGSKAEEQTPKALMAIDGVGRKFNFSKYIFDSLVRNVDSYSKFYMYPRFLQLIIRAQVGDLSSHTTKYSSPTLTQNVFANMRRVGKGFSRVEPPLFEGMLVQQQVVDDVVAVVADDVTTDDVPAADDEHTPPSPTPATTSPPPPQELPFTSHVAPTPPPSLIASPSSPPQ
nr:transposase, MuDR, MULE transposase domain protein [Tanacetum cinerariifolium]